MGLGYHKSKLLEALTMSDFNLQNPHVAKYCASLENGFKQKMWLLTKLPSALFMGVAIQKCHPEKTEVTVPYGWRSQNPFESIYFAAQAAAAEMSTGLLALMAMQGRGNIAVLVQSIEGQFVKKANTKTTFTCLDGHKAYEAVLKAIETGEGQTVTMESIGVQASGEVVSRFKFVWTFKKRK